MGGATGDPRVIASVAVVIGIVLAAGILALTGYFTGTEHRPVKDVGKTSLTGAATVILSGLSVGFESAVYTALVIGAAVFGAFLLGGAHRDRLAVRGGAGRLRPAHHGRRHRRDGHLRPGLRQRAGHRRDVRRRRRREGAQILTELDAVGNTTKAITKGIAIATAVLAATALFGSYSTSVVEALVDANPSRGRAALLTLRASSTRASSSAC